MENTFRLRKAKGAVLAESVAVTALSLPLLILIMLVVVEASQAFLITRSMRQGASLAARALAREYRINKNIVTDAVKQKHIFNSVRIEYMISTGDQFQVPNGGWDLSSTPPTVKVVATYLPGCGNPPLPAFPNPDPLGLEASFRISSAATFRLQE
ncbi:MAG: hypothetical protein SFY67_18745 [Candidatus Melainabacteria bacterium]|nr:hypothetical protein [Candidatus Melainabacteria bacterium]